MNDHTATASVFPKPAYKMLKPADVYSLMGMAEQGYFNFIDVRKKEEFDRGHLEGAASLPVDDLEKRIDELDPDKPTLIYCLKGIRCIKAADQLNKKGFHDLLVLDGGLEAYNGFLKGLK